MTQTVLADFSGLSESFVSMVENGRRPLNRYSDIIALASALRVPPVELAPSLPVELVEAGPGTVAQRKDGGWPSDYLPADVLALPDFAVACAARDLGAIFTVANKRGGAGFTVSHIARRCEMTISQVQDYVKRGRKTNSVGVFERVSDGLHIPSDMLGIGRRQWESRENSDSERGPARRADIADIPGDTQSLADQISELVNSIEITNVGDGTIAYLDDATLRLAHDCLTAPPIQSHERAAALTQRVFDLLASGHQRIGQTRDLYVIAGKLCAVLSWMSSDLGQLADAEAHSRNGWTLADQADHNGLRALLLCTQSKNAYWARRYNDAATFARRGYEYNPPGTARILLACQEADALQALGKVGDAEESLARAERARESISRSDELGGIFACGTARQANYSIATYLRSGSVEAALQQVERAEAAWQGGDDWAFGTWAQVQIGAAIAHVMSAEAEGAAAALQPVLSQPAERSLATLTTRLRREVTPLLETSPIGQGRTAARLREQITDYCKAQPLILPLPAGGDS